MIGLLIVAAVAVAAGAVLIAWVSCITGGRGAEPVEQGLVELHAARRRIEGGLLRADMARDATRLRRDLDRELADASCSEVIDGEAWDR